MRTKSVTTQVLYAVLILLSAFSWPRPTLAQGPQVDVITVEGAITPIVAGYVQRSIETAEEDGAELLVIELDTPGGSVNLMQDIVQEMRNARVPIAVYVTPRGAQAASAGTFLLLGAHVAAMAPNTTVGAASPVSGQGQELSETEAAKATNALVAQLKGLAERRGEEAVAWAEAAVREAAAATESEALEMGLIDALVSDTMELLEEVDGVQVQLEGETVTLNTAEARVNRVPMTPVEQFLHMITDPNIAFILMTIGLNGLLFELASPGGFVAGIIGGISLLLGLYALGVLDVNYTGLLFIALAFILFVVDIKAPTHGALTIGGIVSFVLGSLILFNSPFYAVSRSLIAGVALGTGAFFAFAVQAAVRAQRSQPTTGREALMGAVGEAQTDLDPEGSVFLHGELWTAATEDDAVAKGQKVRVTAVQGLRLSVVQAEDES